MIMIDFSYNSGCDNMAPKQLSGSAKRKIVKKRAQLDKSLEGGILKFTKKMKSCVAESPSEEIMEENVVQGVEIIQDNVIVEENVEIVDVNLEDNVAEEPEDNNNAEDSVAENVVDYNKSYGPLDIYDPGNWNQMKQSFRDLLVERGPIRVLQVDFQFPKDNRRRHFSEDYYTKILQNGEKQDRRWLVYSIAVNKVFCFCCKLFSQQKSTSNLVKGGYQDWGNLSIRLKEHDSSHSHIKCLIDWKEAEKRLQKNVTIDIELQAQIKKEKEHWRQVLLRIFSIVKNLAKNNLAFRGSTEKIWDKHNGMFF